MSQKIRILQKIIKKGYFKQKCQASEKYVHFYALNTWLGLLLHELLHQCGVAWRQAAVALFRCNEAQVALIAAFRSSALLGLVSHLPREYPIDSLWGSGQAGLLSQQKEA